MRKKFMYLGLIVIFTCGFLGKTWYSYVTNTESPYLDDIGMELNARAPGFMNEWGCSQLAANFPDNSLPPYGCN